MSTFCNFGKCPPIGTKIVNRESVYELIATEPYTRKSDGEQTRLLFWLRRREGKRPEILSTGLKCSWPTKVKKFRPEWIKLIFNENPVDPFS